MKKNKKKREIILPTPVENAMKRFNWRMLLLLIGNTILIFAVYYILVYLNFPWIFWIYFGLIIVAIAAYFIYNRGIPRNVDKDMLPEEWSAVEKCNFIDEVNRRKKKSKWLLTVIVPLIFTLIFDYFFLTYNDFFGNLFK